LWREKPRLSQSLLCRILLYLIGNQFIASTWPYWWSLPCWILLPVGNNHTDPMPGRYLQSKH
jgi:hypothetical protein